MRMRYLLPFTLLLCGAAPLKEGAPDPGFAALLARLQAAWNAGDGAAWGREFAPDADSIGVQGVEIHGQALIASRHAKVFATVLKGSTITITLQKVRMLGPDIAVLDTIQKAVVPNDKKPVMAIGANGVHVTCVVQRTGDRWVVVHGQNTVIAPEKGLLPPPT